MSPEASPGVPAPPEGLRCVGEGLRFCEGPVWLDGDLVLVTEIAAGALTTVSLVTGERERVVEGLPGPNGCAPTADGSGRMWVADNGGYFGWVEADDRLFPSPANPDHRGGSLLLANPATGSFEVRCTEVAGSPLVAPNDLVVDADGGVWFTDFGVQDDASSAGRPGVVYTPAGATQATAPTPGSAVVWGTDQANGIGLSADGALLYVAETHSARVWAFDVDGPGSVVGGGGPGERHRGRLLHHGTGVMFDSLAVDPDGWVCVATIGPGGGVSAIDPASGEVVRVGAPDELTTNVAFHATPDGRVCAVMTMSSTGMVAVVEDWVSAREAARRS